VTNRSFLIKIIPPDGYNVYRLRLSRTALAAMAAAAIAIVLGALALHARHAAAERVALSDIDRQADLLAAQLRDLQREDADIRRLLGAGGVPATAAHAASGAHAGASAPVTVAGIRARLAGLAHGSAVAHADASRLDRLTHRVLDLRRIAAVARERMIAALPSLNPVGGGIAAGFGWRVDPWPEFHRGVDLEAEYGTPVHAAADGTVVAAGWEGGFGYKVALDHGNGYQTWYAHLSRFAVAVGQHIRKGEIIAYVGATGDATGPHLHYQVMRQGEAIDPQPFLNGVPATVLATLPVAPRVQ
jgi:murein DD-endopeptidase MepM/ murein hydrolase activator NlpD